MSTTDTTTAATTSKDHFFQQVANLSNAMTDAHGTDFAMGTLVLAARFLAEGQAKAAAAAKAEAAAPEGPGLVLASA